MSRIFQTKFFIFCPFPRVRSGIRSFILLNEINETGIHHRPGRRHWEHVPVPDAGFCQPSPAHRISMGNISCKLFRVFPDRNVIRPFRQTFLAYDGVENVPDYRSLRGIHHFFQLFLWKHQPVPAGRLQLFFTVYVIECGIRIDGNSSGCGHF